MKRCVEFEAKLTYVDIISEFEAFFMLAIFLAVKKAK